jgi:3-hydroxymyristoyl/3-hydroxydecanoyl-(acyl carrier protein) dehydratase
VATRLVRPTSWANDTFYMPGVAGLSSVIQTFEILCRSDS